MILGRIEIHHKDVKNARVPVVEYSMPQFVQADLDLLWLRVLSHRHPASYRNQRLHPGRRSQQDALDREKDDELSLMFDLVQDLITH